MVAVMGSAGSVRQRLLVSLTGLFALFQARDALAAVWRPCWIDHGAVLAPATFGDMVGDVVLDPGRSQSALHDTAARSAGLTGGAVTAAWSLAGQTARSVTLPIRDLDPETVSRAVPRYCNPGTRRAA